MTAFTHVLALLYGVGYGTFVGSMIEQGHVSQQGWVPVLTVNVVWPFIFVASVVTATDRGELQ